jgi:2-polyprenyl-3-methyl-5-hydroxy-6-metoxy-1,4-benzoquinol methylase
MSEVLDHVRDPLIALRRCLEWLAPGGWLLVTTPNGRWESVEHLHEFTVHTLCSVLARAGARDLRVFVIADRDGGEPWLAAEVRQRGVVGASG